jgi:hypothetical protein
MNRYYARESGSLASALGLSPRWHCGYCDGPLRIVRRRREWWEEQTSPKAAPVSGRDLGLVNRRRVHKIVTGRAVCLACGALYREHRSEHYDSPDTWSWLMVTQEEYDNDQLPAEFQ